MAGPVRKQPHFVLGPTSARNGRRPCGAKRGAPFAAIRDAALYRSLTSPSERLQIRHEIGLLRLRKIQVELLVVVIDYREQIGGAPVVEVRRVLPKRA